MDKNSLRFGIVSDASTLLRLFEEFQKRGAKTVDEKNTIMFEFFSRKENKPKVQNILVGEDDFKNEIKKHNTILSGEVDKNGKTVYKTYQRKDKNKESES